VTKRQERWEQAAASAANKGETAFAFFCSIMARPSAEEQAATSSIFAPAERCEEGDFELDCPASRRIEETIVAALGDDVDWKFWGGPEEFVEREDGFPQPARLMGFKYGGHTFTVKVVRES
jgi:hypothetical protein